METAREIKDFLAQLSADNYLQIYKDRSIPENDEWVDTVFGIILETSIYFLIGNLEPSEIEKLLTLCGKSVPKRLLQQKMSLLLELKSSQLEKLKCADAEFVNSKLTILGMVPTGKLNADLDSLIDELLISGVELFLKKLSLSTIIGCMKSLKMTTNNLQDVDKAVKLLMDKIFDLNATV